MKWRCVVWHFWHLTISPSLYYNFASYRVDWTGLHIVLDCNSPFVYLKWQVMKNGKNPGETNCWIVYFRLFWSIRFVKRVASIPSHEIFVSSCFLVPGVGMGKNKQSASSLIRGPLLYDGTEIKTFLGMKSVLPSRERALLPILLFQPWSDMITMAPFT